MPGASAGAHRGRKGGAKRQTNGNRFGEERQWLRLPNESAQAYSGFRAYLEADPGKRSIAAAYRQTKGLPSDAEVRVPGYFGAWASRYRWQERGDTWDAFLEQLAAARKQTAELSARVMSLVEVELRRWAGRNRTMSEPNWTIRPIRSPAMKRLFLFAAFFVLFILLACNEGPSPEQPPAPATSTRRVTSRPTATAATNARRVTPRPTATTPPTDTPVPAPHFTVNRERVNVRTGPGIVFSIIGTVEQGDRFDIGGRNVAGDWLEFCCVNGQRGWIYAPLLIVSDEVAPIRLAQNIPTAPTPTNTPVPPLDTPAPAPQPTPSDGLGVTIASENRCSPYNADDYSYSQSVESQIVAQQRGRIYSPYSGRYFASAGGGAKRQCT